jgi:C-terminal processing protease CtpA/Prc
VIAFSRLLGYVRHFYPGDEAFGANWSNIAVEGMRSVESAKNPAELAKRLEAIYKPVAPGLQVFVNAKTSVPSLLLPPVDYKNLKLVSYRHTGFGQGIPGSAYRSDRVVKAVSELSNNDPVALQRTYRASLDGGVSCIFPLAVFADEKGTLPRGSYQRDKEKELLITYSGNDRATRLADVALAWNVIQHFYPYFDVEKVDWNQTLRDSLSEAAMDGDEMAFLQTLRRMIAGIKDGHGGIVFPGEDTNYYLPVLFDWIEDKLVIVNVVPEKAGGSRPGDIVLKFDGKPARRAIEENEKFISGATSQWRRKRALWAMRQGLKDSEANLEVRSGSDRPKLVTLRRDAASSTLEEIRPPKIDEIRPDIYYLDLDRVSDDDFKSVLTKLEKARGVIFDLRGYPKVSPLVISHLTDKPVQSARWMIPIITAPDQSGKIEYDTSGRWNLEPMAPKLGGKIAFLTDGSAISYAESYMGIIEAYHLASIVGETTAGTNGNINPVKLPGGYTVIWTGMKVLKHDGSQHHGVGIKPTDPVSRTIRGLATGKDEQLDAAIEIVSN